MSETALAIINQNIQIAEQATTNLRAFFAGNEDLRIQNNLAGLYLKDASGIKEISSDEEYVSAGEIVGLLGDVGKEMDKIISPYVGFANQVHKAMVSVQKEYSKMPEEERKRLKRAIGIYQEKKDKEAREAAAIAAAEARRREEEKAIAEAARLEAEGKTGEAAAVIEEAISAPVPIVAAPVLTPKISGVTLREYWSFEVIDKTKLPMEYLVPDMTAIGATVRALKKNAVSALNGAVTVKSERK